MKIIKIIILFLFLTINIFANIKLNLGYIKSENYDLNYNNYKTGKDVSNGYTDFLLKVKDYDNNRSFLNINFDNLNSKEDIKYNFEIELYEGFGTYIEKESVVYPIINIKNWDQNFPYKCYIQYKDLKIGRDKLAWGVGKFGNLILSDFSKYYDMIEFKHKFKYVDFDYVLISLNPYLTKVESDIIDNDTEINSQGKIYSEPYKFFIAHRLTFNLTRKIKMALTEAQVVGGKIPGLDLINPLYIYHNSFTEGYSNVMAGIDMNYKSKKYEIYGSGVLDDIVVADEKDSNSKPTALGYLGGFEYNLKNIKLNFEYARTSKWLYNRENEYLKFTNRRIIVTTYGNSGRYVVDYPIGYFLGADARTYSLKIDYNNFRFIYQKYEKGEVNLQTDYNKAIGDKNWMELSGIIEVRDIFNIEYKYKNIKFFYNKEFINNFSNQSGEKRVSDEFGFKVLLKI
ncbi:capsule assembly Wzi family protein [Haliovirga abyssi]|uniref:Porin n=1 Tax=Haliovirga abyssi TaxID=2996794 RepID=A0AAU9DKU6_9FUSO|nr:capsule assembly Wzi family protein [Haliovirga abyssi]BDU50547.1 hypothetical protein HLVA_11160 [Haliovirga abyssi]